MDWLKLQIRLNLPCGRLSNTRGWKRTREHSLRLADQELWLIWAGKGWMESHAGRHELRPGFCVWMRPGGIYDAGQNEGSPLGITYVHFDAFDAKGRRLDAETLAPGREFFDLVDLSYIDGIMRRIVELSHRTTQRRDMPTPAASLLLKGLLADLALDTLGGRDRADSRRRNVFLASAAEIREKAGRLPPISVLAERAGMSAPHFSRGFKKIIGVSPQEYAMQSRIHQAQQLLLESNMSVGEIAELLGYNDVFFFSRQFKQLVGVPPSVYRGTHANRLT